MFKFTRGYQLLRLSLRKDADSERPTNPSQILETGFAAHQPLSSTVLDSAHNPNVAQADGLDPPQAQPACTNPSQILETGFAAHQPLSSTVLDSAHNPNVAQADGLDPPLAQPACTNPSQILETGFAAHQPLSSTVLDSAHNPNVAQADGLDPPLAQPACTNPSQILETGFAAHQPLSSTVLDSAHNPNVAQADGLDPPQAQPACTNPSQILETGFAARQPLSSTVLDSAHNPNVAQADGLDPPLAQPACTNPSQILETGLAAHQLLSSTVLDSAHNPNPIQGYGPCPPSATPANIGLAAITLGDSEVAHADTCSVNENVTDHDNSILDISVSDLLPMGSFAKMAETLENGLEGAKFGNVTDNILDVSESGELRVEEAVEMVEEVSQLGELRVDEVVEMVEEASQLGEARVEVATEVNDHDERQPVHLKKKVGKDQWQKNVQKKLRQQGQQYMGRSYKDGKITAQLKDGRKIGDRCKCQKPSVNQCKEITDVQRIAIFDKVWRMTWNEKMIFVLSMTEMSECKRRRVDEATSKKKSSFQYYLQIDGVRAKVCFIFFLATTGLKETWVRDVLKKHKQSGEEESSETDRRSKNEKRNERQQKLRDFLSALPKMESHYCRKSSSKLYLEPIFQSVSAVYRLYTSSTDSPLCRSVFEAEFNAMNLSPFQPRKDQCDICFSFEQGNVPEQLYTEHRAKKERAQKEKATDKDSTDPRTKIFTVDLQSVLLCPMCKASALYYRTKLCVHNYTIYDLQTKDVTCYIWNETDGGLSSNEFASCLVDLLSQHIDSCDVFIIYSDGCTAQNRNVVLSSALCYFAMKNNVTVIQKILEKGHTQMEVDSVHSCIERQLKNQFVQVPSDYAVHAANARKVPRPYAVKYLDFSFFKDFSKVNSLKSIRPGRNVGDPVVTNLRALMYKPCGEIQYKLDFDAPWCNLPLKRNESTDIIQEPSPLHPARLKITETKFKHLQELKSIIHADHHSFYDSIPH